MVWHATGSSSYTVPSGYTRVRTIEAAQQAVTAGQQINIGAKPVLIEKLQ